MTALDPCYRIGDQMTEVLTVHRGVSAEEAHARCVEMLGRVYMPDPARVMERYPHQLSGGQQQRVVIAMALMAEPSLLVMDEPTTGLDVTVEAAVLDLVARLRAKHNSAIVFISHNLGTVVRVCDRIGVLNLGQLIFEGDVRSLIRDQQRLSLTVQNLSPAGRQLVESALQTAGATLVSVEHPQTTLESLFLEAVRRDARGAGHHD